MSLDTLRGRSAELQLLSNLEVWHESLDKRNHVHCVLLDAAKAFDRVDHSALLSMLQSIGLDHVSLQWFFSYLSGRRIRTKVSNHLSSPSTITSGVPQGSVLSPLLFLIYYKDIPSVASALTALFADDTLWFHPTCQGFKSSPCCPLQADLDALSSWAIDLNVSFKGEVRTINDRNICERRSCMKKNGKSPTFIFVSGEERRPSEVQRVSWGWRLPGATHSSADLTWIRK